MRFFPHVLCIPIFALLLPACLPQVGDDVVRIPNAENIRKTDSGRIFVSGLDAVHEIVRNADGTYSKQSVIDEGCTYYGGLAQLRDWMFSVCVDLKPRFVDGHLSLAGGRLYALSLSDGQVVLAGDLNDFSLPNGLDAMSQDDVILIADEDVALKGGVAKAVIDFSSGVPLIASMQTRWIGTAQNVSAANGVRLVGDSVYLTDIDKIKRVPLNEIGEPGAAQVLYQAATVLDDLAPYCDGVLVADFLRGLLIYTTLDGRLVTKSAAAFTTPSSVLVDAAPMFDASQMLVTLSGGTSGNTSSRGGRLISVTADAAGLPGCAP